MVFSTIQIKIVSRICKHFLELWSRSQLYPKSLKVSKWHRRVEYQEIVQTWFIHVSYRINYNSSERVMLHSLEAVQNDIRPVSTISSWEIHVVFTTWISHVRWLRSACKRALCWAAHTWSACASLSLIQIQKNYDDVVSCHFTNELPQLHVRFGSI